MFSLLIFLYIIELIAGAGVRPTQGDSILLWMLYTENLVERSAGGMKTVLSMICQLCSFCL
jgi:hypothetical protein